jgi:hypothetical protein
VTTAELQQRTGQRRRKSGVDGIDKPTMSALVGIPVLSLKERCHLDASEIVAI